METKKHGRGPGERLQIGGAILANARVVDAAPVRRRLAAFATAHRNYVAVQTKMEAVEADLRTVGAKVARRGKDVDAAVEAIALALAFDGHPRMKPFAVLGSATPSRVRNAAPGDKPAAVHQLAAAALASRAAGRRTREAARAADQAAGRLEAALTEVEPLEATLAELRRQRETLGQPWDRALGILRRAARAAEDDGAAGLYAALFGPGAPSARKNGKPAPAPAPDPTPAPAPVSSA